MMRDEVVNDLPNGRIRRGDPSLAIWFSALLAFAIALTPASSNDADLATAEGVMTTMAPGSRTDDLLTDEIISEIEALLRENRALRAKINDASEPLPNVSKADNPISVSESDWPKIQREIAQVLRDELKGEDATVYLQGHHVIVRLPSLTYRSGATKMPRKVREMLEPIASAAAKFSDHFDLVVEGHADASPVRKGSSTSNWAVAFNRADHVALALDELGVAQATIKVASRGDGLPVESNPLAAANRRVELVFAPRRSPPNPRVSQKPVVTQPQSALAHSVGKSPIVAPPNEIPSNDGDNLVELPVIVMNQQEPAR